MRLLRLARCVARRGVQLLDGHEDVQSRMLRAVLANRLRGPGDDRKPRYLTGVTITKWAARTWSP
jgi:hypothetical protein